MAPWLHGSGAFGPVGGREGHVLTGTTSLDCKPPRRVQHRPAAAFDRVARAIEGRSAFGLDRSYRSKYRAGAKRGAGNRALVEHSCSSVRGGSCRRPAHPHRLSSPNLPWAGGPGHAGLASLPAYPALLRALSHHGSLFLFGGAGTPRACAVDRSEGEPVKCVAR